MGSSMNGTDSLVPLDYLNINLALVNTGLFLILFVWSVFLFQKPRVPRAFLVSSLAMYLFTGAAVLLHFYTVASGHQIPSGRSGGHLRYVICQLLTVVAAHLLGAGKLTDPRVGSRFMWLIMLFGLGVSFETARVYVVQLLS